MRCKYSVSECEGGEACCKALSVWQQKPEQCCKPRSLHYTVTSGSSMLDMTSMMALNTYSATLARLAIACITVEMHLYNMCGTYPCCKHSSSKFNHTLTVSSSALREYSHPCQLLLLINNSTSSTVFTLLLLLLLLLVCMLCSANDSLCNWTSSADIHCLHCCSNCAYNWQLRYSALCYK
jgi:hypothetical protein